MQNYNVSHVFLVPTILTYSLAEMEGLHITRVTTHGEKAAAYMADGYARASHRPGICMAQTIGAANLAAGLRDAYLACSPAIAITGGRSPENKHRHVYQEVEDYPLLEPLTKLNAQIDTVERLPDLLCQAFRSATTGCPGPVHLETAGH
jgi:acetolactate synthase-1/2/3 large subunit